jgi:hypothetical protein
MKKEQQAHSKAPPQQAMVSSRLVFLIHGEGERSREQTPGCLVTWETPPLLPYQWV